MAYGDACGERRRLNPTSAERAINPSRDDREARALCW